MKRDDSVSEDAVLNFRCDRDIQERAKGRTAGGVVKFPDLLRLAVKAIADDDATVFCEVLKEAGKDYSAGINSAWLYYKAHELFTYEDGVLYRKGNKGAGVRGAPVDLVMRGGSPCVTINGGFYPVKDVIWLMFYGHVSGEVVCIEGEDIRISNLMVRSEGEPVLKMRHRVTPDERDYIKSGKLRALVIGDVEGERERNSLEALCDAGTVFYLHLHDGAGWMCTRSAIHAQRLEGGRFIVSLS